jgi:CheY-like chemotaxis protein
MCNEKISLLAEIEPEVATDIRKYLSSLGYYVYPTISKGEELLEIAVTIHPSLILTDIHLSGQFDGVEAISRMEEIIKIPYIFITAYDDYSRIITSYYLNPVSLIKKPIDQENLIKSVSKADIIFQDAIYQDN